TSGCAPNWRPRPGGTARAASFRCWKAATAWAPCAAAWWRTCAAWAPERSAGRLEIQGRGIDAVAQPGRRRPVGEHMPQVRLAAGAADLDPVHAVAGVQVLAHRRPVQGPGVAGPAAAGVVLVGRTEQGRPAGHAHIGTGLLVVPVLAGEGPFRGRTAADGVLLRAELGPPLLVALFHPAAHGCLLVLPRPRGSGQAYASFSRMFPCAVLSSACFPSAWPSPAPPAPRTRPAAKASSGCAARPPGPCRCSVPPTQVRRRSAKARRPTSAPPNWMSAATTSPCSAARSNSNAPTSGWAPTG